MPDAFRKRAAVCPGEISDNSPALKRWVAVQMQMSPGGTTESFNRPSGTPNHPTARPSVKTLGYYQLSLRDKNRPIRERIMIRPASAAVEIDPGPLPG